MLDSPPDLRTEASLHVREAAGQGACSLTIKQIRFIRSFFSGRFFSSLDDFLVVFPVVFDWKFAHFKSVLVLRTFVFLYYRICSKRPCEDYEKTITWEIEKTVEKR